MPDIFLILALVFALIVGLLFFAPDRKLLNFVDYGPGDAVRRLNRYAAVRLPIPLLVGRRRRTDGGARRSRHSP